MKKLVLFVGAATLAAPALADTPLKFERDGIAYVGTIKEVNGVRYIQGHEERSRRAFSLQVRDGQVSGVYDGEAVFFAEPTGTKLAAR